MPNNNHLSAIISGFAKAGRGLVQNTFTAG